MRRFGYTSIEMMVVVTVTAVLLGLATPGFQRQRAETAVRTAASQTLSALHLARRLALARGQSVTVCGTHDGARCATGGALWVLFANGTTGVESRREAGEAALRRWTQPQGVQASGTRGYAAFQPRPGAASTVTFVFRHPGSPDASRSVVVSQTGRPRVAVP